MLKKQFFFLIIISLFIGGCNLPVQDDTGLVKAETNVNNMEKAGIITVPKETVRINGQVSIPVQGTDSFEIAKITKQYFSALGQQCMQVSTIKNNQTKLFCHLQNHQWKQMPLLENLTTQSME